MSDVGAVVPIRQGGAFSEKSVSILFIKQMTYPDEKGSINMYWVDYRTATVDDLCCLIGRKLGAEPIRIQPGDIPIEGNERSLLTDLPGEGWYKGCTKIVEMPCPTLAPADTTEGEEGEAGDVRPLGTASDADGASDPGEPSIEDQMVEIKWLGIPGRPHGSEKTLGVTVNFLTTSLHGFIASVRQRTGDSPEVVIASGHRIDMVAHRDTVLNDLPGTWSKDCTVRFHGIVPMANNAQPPPDSDESHAGEGRSTHHEESALAPLAGADQQEDGEGWSAEARVESDTQSPATPIHDPDDESMWVYQDAHGTYLPIPPDAEKMGGDTWGVTREPHPAYLKLMAKRHERELEKYVTWLALNRKRAREQGDTVGNWGA